MVLLELNYSIEVGVTPPHRLPALAASSHELMQISFKFPSVDCVFVSRKVFDFRNIAWLSLVAKVWNIKKLR